MSSPPVKFQIGPDRNKFRYTEVPGSAGLRWVCERRSDLGAEGKVLVLVRMEEGWWACDVECGSVEMSTLPESVRPVFKLAEGLPWEEGEHTWQYNKKAWEENANPRVPEWAGGMRFWTTVLQKDKENQGGGVAMIEDGRQDDGGRGDEMCCEG